MKESFKNHQQEEIFSLFVHEIETELGYLKSIIFDYMLEKKSLLDLAKQARNQKKNLTDLIDDILSSKETSQGGFIESLWNQTVGWFKGTVLDYFLGWRELITKKREETRVIIQKTEQSLTDLGATVTVNPSPDQNNKSPDQNTNTPSSQHQPTIPDIQSSRNPLGQHQQEEVSANSQRQPGKEQRVQEQITQKQQQETQTNTPTQLTERLATFDESLHTETFILTRALQLGYVPTKPGPWTKRDLLTGQRMVASGPRLDDWFASSLLPLRKTKLTSLETQAKKLGVDNNPLLTDLKTYLTNPKAIKRLLGGSEGLTIIATLTTYLESGDTKQLSAYTNEVGKRMIEKTITEIESIRKNHKKATEKIEKDLAQAIERNPNQQAILTQKAQNQLHTLTEQANNQLKPHTEKLLCATKYCDETTLTTLGKQYGTFTDLLTVNGGTKKLLSKRKRIRMTGEKIITGGTGGLATIGIGIALLNATTRKDKALVATDIGLGMIPIVGGVYDLGAAISGKDITGSDLSTSERWTRAGFGVLGLIPGIGTLVKGSVGVGKRAGSIGFKIDKGVRAAKMIGTTATYTYLGYSVGTVAFDMVQIGGEQVQTLFDHLNDIIDPLPALK